MGIEYEEKIRRITQYEHYIVLPEQIEKQLREVLKKRYPGIRDVGELSEIQLLTKKGYGGWFKVSIIKQRKSKTSES